MLSNKLKPKSNKMRRLLRILFGVVIIASFSFSVYCAYCYEWDTLTACIALIVAVISAWIAYESFNRIAEAEKAHITYELDFASRQGLCLFVVKNKDKHPA